MMDFDILYLIWIGEKLILLFFLKLLVCCVCGFGDGLIWFVEICVWFENDIFMNDLGSECWLE